MKFKKPSELPKGDGGTGNNLYIKISDGGEAIFVPRGEIHEFYSVFGVKGEVPEGTEGARARFKMNAVVFEDGKYKAKIYEFGPGVYSQFYEISQVCEVTTTKLRLSRKGSTKENTEYFLLPVIKEPLSPAQVAAISQVELNVLDKAPKERSDEWKF